MKLVFELCADNLEACQAAFAGGAQRIELCTHLDVGGLTPDLALVRSAVEASELPVHVLLRATEKTFRALPEVVAAMQRSMLEAKRCGAAGFVLGFLGEEGRVDVARTRAFVELAWPLPVTFHRAFDDTPDPEQALEDVIQTGCTRLLTSGGAREVLSGAAMLRRLVHQAGERIAVAAGGGLRLTNAREVAQRTGCRHFHGSLRETPGDASAGQDDLAQRVRIMVETLTAALERVDSEDGKEET